MGQCGGYGPFAGGGVMFAYVGSRTTRERGSRGDGLSVYRVDDTSQGWTLLQTVGGLVNPSYLAFDRTGRILFAVHGDRSEVSAFAIGADGRLTWLNRQDVAGRNPVHLAVDASNRFLLVANYATGAVVSLPIAADGRLEPVCHILDLPGEAGPHRVEQGSSHPHQILADPAHRFFIVPDKGLDCVFSLAVDAGSGRLSIAGRVGARAGAGPRHAAFHPAGDVMFLANELDSTVTTLAYEAETGRMEALDVVSSLPRDFFASTTSAAIVATGSCVYVSNRGHDSVARFGFDPAARRLELLDWTASGGQTPRFMTAGPSGRLYVANEQSDTIVPFPLDPQSGALMAPGGAIGAGSPVCVLFGG
jgi:6-phosphogluconolactonase